MDKSLVEPAADSSEALTNLLERVEITSDRLECEAVVDQATILLEQFCVNLPAAEARGLNPIERLRRLRQKIPAGTIQFYRQLLSIFAELGDRHTDCNLPAPFAGKVAFLPLLVRDFFQNGERRLAVVASAVDEVSRGDLLTAWNGVPVAEVLRRQMSLQLGANDDARYAKAVQTLTFRPLDWMPPPLEAELTLESISPGAEHRKVHLQWRVAERAWLDEQFGHFGEKEENDQPSDAGLRSSLLNTPYGIFGYLKVLSLHARAETILPRFVNAFESLPAEGLILDLRGCEQGIIPTAEQLLQLFTSQTIEPQPFQFRITKLISRIVQTCPALSKWRSSVEMAASRGEEFSEGLTLTSKEEANSVGRKYRGPVVLLVDARTYSSAEMFVAGFQDHSLGMVLGSAPRTGGGGASLWQQDTIYKLSGDAMLQPIPGAPVFRIAVRRCRRVRAQAGQLIEGVGTIPDLLHLPTRNDLLNKDADLMARAAKLLAESK